MTMLPNGDDASDIPHRAFPPGARARTVVAFRMLGGVSGSL